MKNGMKLSLAATLLLSACATNADFGRYSHQAADYNAQLAIEYLKEGHLQSAHDKIERALEQDPRNANVQAAAALVNQELGYSDVAQRHYKRALRLKPDDPEILNSYGVFLCSHQQAEEGERLLLQAARNPLYRTPKVAYGNAGTCLQKAGKPADAQAYFQKVM